MNSWGGFQNIFLMKYVPPYCDSLRFGNPSPDFLDRGVIINTIK